jgi:hypothetical protein
LLFDRIGISESLQAVPETLEQRIAKLPKIAVFFWMMVAVTAKHLARADAFFVVRWIKELNRMLHERKRLIATGPSQDWAGSYSSLPSNCAAQIDALYLLSEAMVTLMPKIADMGAFFRSSPIPTLEVLINFAREKGNA